MKKPTPILPKPKYNELPTIIPPSKQADNLLIDSGRNWPEEQKWIKFSTGYSPTYFRDLGSEHNNKQKQKV